MSPADIAPLAACLASYEGGYVSGQIFGLRGNPSGPHQEAAPSNPF
jgi:hypothetical protein